MGFFIMIYITASENYCPASIPDGALASDCTRSAGSQCDYTCNSGFLKNNAVTALVCLSSGQWNFKGVFCQPGKLYFTVHSVSTKHVYK